ncbi:efflux RND transporter periplasmic adaptor subunit [Candidatus Methylobacter oryzae]|uniref:Efflux RND transporter periplasmic adaptor subunit n=1 Tax=Candidatus Methylobacter oryzae TaxID=2497749 RepID=A0ABY3C4D9_9GAMM|nr:efflux RND transporter periplasmic adaptor subunit [Candidatus Methylobacter oryzae]TRW89513.1 efflux RND transporter periplasmic adaptor subunit [Candidatus Methylobacter oryzae]
MNSRHLPLVSISLLFLTLAGCAQPGKDRQTLRPVNVVRITSQQTPSDSSFPGQVKARFETALSFRVAGKLIKRSVDIGDRVRKGQVLAKLEPSDYRFAAQNIKAQLIAAKADRAYSKDDLSRYRELFEQYVVSQPELDRRQILYIGARQKVAALEAQLGQADNQLAYTDLLADRDGVVTALEAEAGQVVALGQPIIKLAQGDEKEIAIDIPEHRIAGIKQRQEVGVTLWADGDKRIKASIREIASAADPVSRTYRVKATILDGKDDARLGMTATVWIPSSMSGDFTVPLSAVFTSHHEPGQTSVWLVDERSSTVKAVPVRIGGAYGGERVAVTGLSAGQLIVSAGTNRLIEGQAVRLPQGFTTAMNSRDAGGIKLSLAGMAQAGPLTNAGRNTASDLLESLLAARAEAGR